MATKFRFKAGLVKTPVGTAVFPHLNEPDTKFKEEGEYKVSLALSGDEASSLMASIDKMQDEALAAFKESSEGKGKKKVGKAKPPYREELDEEDEPTGRTLFSFKSSYKPSIVDSKVKPISPDTKLWGGSEIRVNADVGGWHIPLQGGVGVTMYMKGVQVIKAVGGNSGASDFDEVDGGFVDDGFDVQEESVEQEADY